MDEIDDPVEADEEETALEDLVDELENNVDEGVSFVELAVFDGSKVFRGFEEVRVLVEAVSDEVEGPVGILETLEVFRHAFALEDAVVLLAIVGGSLNFWCNLMMACSADATSSSSWLPLLVRSRKFHIGTKRVPP